MNVWQNDLLCSHRLTDMLQKLEEVLACIPSTIAPMMRPFVERVEEVLGRGVTTLNWSSLQHDDCEWLMLEAPPPLFSNAKWVNLEAYCYGIFKVEI